MNIGGILRNSLIDFPSRPAVVIFTQGCNWCCPYCHNASLIPRHGQTVIAPEDVLAQLAKRPVGARNLVVTGGEPTQQPTLIPFLQAVVRSGVHVKLDTNGSNPLVLEQVIEAKLVDYVALDVKGPLEHYERYCGKRIASECVAECVRLLKQDQVDYEFRITVSPTLHELSDLEVVGKLLSGGRQLFLQAFRSANVLRQSMGRLVQPSSEFMEDCAQLTRPWIPTMIRQ